jgi:hypothetical protein
MTSKQQQLYFDYGDVVFIDATYVTNVYKIPLVHFVVIDNFDKIRIVGTCISVRECTEDYDWMFSTLVQETGTYPRYVVTDEGLKKGIILQRGVFIFFYFNLCFVLMFVKHMRTLLAGAAIRRSLQNQLPNSKSFLCEYHLVNNLKKKMPSTWPEEKKESFMEDWYFVERSRSASVFLPRYIRLQEMAAEFAGRESSLYTHLFEKGKEKVITDWPNFIRQHHQSLRLSSASVESAHKIFKTHSQKPGKSMRLAEVVKNAMSVLTKQEDNEHSLSIDQVTTDWARNISQDEGENWKAIGNDVKNTFTPFVLQSLQTELTYVNGLKHKAVTRSQMQDLLRLQENFSKNLPSDAKLDPSCIVVSDVPKRILDLFNSDANSKIFRTYKRVGYNVDYLRVGEDIQIYSPQVMTFYCSCELFSLKGLLCRHYLKLYLEGLVGYHLCMYSQRWLFKPIRASDGSQDLRLRAPLHLYYIDKDPVPISEDVSRLLLQRAKDMLGARTINHSRQEELVSNIVSREDCLSLNERIQAAWRNVSASVASFVEAGERDKLASVLENLERMPQARTLGIHMLSVLDDIPSRVNEHNQRKRPYQLYRARHKMSKRAEPNE